MIKKIITITLCLTLMLGMLTACKNDPSDTPENGNPNNPSNIAGGLNNDSYNYEPPEYIYIAKSVPFPNEVSHVSHLVYYENKVVFASSPTGIYNDVRLYSMNLDGTDSKELPGYVLFEPEEISGYYSNAYLKDIVIDSSGNIWVFEEWDYSNSDLPKGSNIRKLDSNGNELVSIDIGELSLSTRRRNQGSFGIDNFGNVYVNVQTETDSLISVLDSNGNTQFQLNLEDASIGQFILMQDGSVAFTSFTFNNNDEYILVLQTIDLSNKSFGISFEVPDIGVSIYPGSNDFDLLIRDRNNISLYGFDVRNNETVKLLSWLESDVQGNNIRNIIMLPDERIICTNSVYERIDASHGRNKDELLILTKVPYNETEHKKIITLATFYADETLSESVISFNRTNPNYRIHIIDYFVDSDFDYDIAITRLTTDIITGRIPDILDVSIDRIPYNQFAKSGLFENLYPYIDSDPLLSRDDFVESVLRASEIDGCLYRVFPAFHISTLVGHPFVVGANTGWTMSEFTDVINANPNADYPLGADFSKLYFLQTVLSVGIDEYVNFDAGTVHFDTDSFSQLLKLASSFPDEYDYHANDFMSWDRYVATGRQILTHFWVSSAYSIQYSKALFGGEIVYKGYPSENGNGNSLSTAGAALTITTSSANKEGAWQFLRIHLDKDWQIANAWYGIPLNKSAFENYVERLKEEALRNVDMYSGIGDMGRPGENQMQPITDADIEQLKTLINSVSTISDYLDEQLWNIVSEGASDYFRGAKNLEDTVRIIQSRASIYVSEQS